MKRLKVIFVSILLISVANNMAKAKENIIQEWQKIIEKRYEYRYNPPNFDPFSSFINELKPAPLARIANIFFPEYDLRQLKLVGIAKMKGKYIAIIEDPQGRAAFLKEGSYLGSNRGQIIKITSSEIQIVEKYVDFRGKIIKATKILSLAKKEGPCTEEH